MRLWRVAAMAAAWWPAMTVPGRAELAALPEVVVVGVTPLAGAAVDRAAVAAPVQTATAADIERSRALDLTAFMNREIGGVYINDIQNNPLQPDVNYRGYTASPLLGTPQGLSIYMDGVRLNQPFGDVVSWDLIPKAAVASVALMPGSNPLFGLNTLGGALSIRTKDGLTAPGTALQLGYGSNRRGQAEFETGGHTGSGLNWYLTGATFKEDGWRDSSPSKASQLFGKLGWSGGDTDLYLSASAANTDLTGNGLQEQGLLQKDYASIYTKPDQTRNRSVLVNAALAHRFSDALSFSGDAYFRAIRTRTLNGDINDGALGENVLQPSAAERVALAAAGYTGVPASGETAANTPFPSWRCIANALLNSEPNEKCDGLLNRTATRQSDAGASGQFTLTGDFSGRPNTLIAGAAYLSSRARFIQSSQFAYLTPDRGVVGVTGPGAFADGTQNSENAFDARVNLSGRTRTWSLYATDRLKLTQALNLTVSGRYDDTAVDDRDAITPGGGPGSLDGHHHFSRLNPALGLTFNPGPNIGAYVGVNQGSRAPSAIELGCADPDNPCRLPNALAGDPPLRQVVTRTLEAGLRGKVAGRWTWSIGLFRADNRQDILFVADNQAGFGYFRNFGQTRRQGVELSAAGRLGRLDMGADYTYLDATYQSAETVGADGNSTADGPAPGFGGNIRIRPGDRIPLIPQHLFKANARWDLTGRLSVDADMIAVGKTYARGNENNQHQPDGVYYLGSGTTDAYAVFNLGAGYRPVAGVKLFAQINNIFDTRYDSAAQLGATGFTSGGAFIARPFSGPAVAGELPLRSSTFYAPGAPRTLWVGVRYQFGG